MRGKGQGFENKVFHLWSRKNGKKLLSYLTETKEVEVIAFIDDDNNKQKTEIDGVRCIDLDEAMRIGGKDGIVFISPKKVMR